MAETSPRRRRLGTRLRELRAARYRFGAELARHLGWQQTKVSKLELGDQLPTANELDIWVEAVGASEEARCELQDLLARARITYSSWADAYRAGDIGSRQRATGAREATGRLRHYQPAMIPGLLQTIGYARELLTIPGGAVLTGATESSIEDLIAARMQRQNLLYGSEQEIQVVIGEAALGVHFGTVATLRGQLDRLATLADLDSLDLRVLPESTASPIMPLSGFSVEDDSVLYIETLTGEHRIDDPEDVAAHVRAFELLSEAALRGREAMDLIQRVSRTLT